MGNRRAHDALRGPSFKGLAPSPAAFGALIGALSTRAITPGERKDALYTALPHDSRSGVSIGVQIASVF